MSIEKLNIIYNFIISAKELYKDDKLLLSENDINIIPKEIKYLNNLRYLSLNSNEIKEIPTEIMYLIKIQFIHLSYNILESINSLMYLPTLRELYLNNNRIKKNT